MCQLCLMFRTIFFTYKTGLQKFNSKLYSTLPLKFLSKMYVQFSMFINLVQSAINPLKMPHLRHNKIINVPQTLQVNNIGAVHVSVVLTFIRAWSASRLRNGPATSPCYEYIRRCLCCECVVYTQSTVADERL